MDAFDGAKFNTSASRVEPMVAGFKRYRSCPRSSQPAMAVAIVRDHAISLSKEEHHLAVPVGTSRPDSCTSSTCAACDGVC